MKPQRFDDVWKGVHAQNERDTLAENKNETQKIIMNCRRAIVFAGTKGTRRSTARKPRRLQDDVSTLCLTTSSPGKRHYDHHQSLPSHCRMMVASTRASSSHLNVKKGGVCFPPVSSSQQVRSFSSDEGNNNNSHRQRLQPPQPSLQQQEGQSKKQHTSAAIKIERLGDHPYGSREYQLWIPSSSLSSTTTTTTTTTTTNYHNDNSNSNVSSTDMMITKASLRAHRNILFAPQYLLSEEAEEEDYVESLLPLLEVALVDASSNGEQPQAMATLHGLCDWIVANHSNEDQVGGSLKDYVQQELSEEDNHEKVWEAVMAMATGIPRPGHSVVGAGTYQDGQPGWEILAKRYCQLLQGQESSSTQTISSSLYEIQLFSQRDGQLVEIVHLADTKPNYLRSAGGAMARFFFL